MMDAKGHTEFRVIRMKLMQIRIGVSRSTIYDWMNPNSPRYDCTFPKPFKIGSSAVGWLEESVNEWIMSKVAGACTVSH